MIVIDSLVNKNRDRLVFEDIETRLAGIQCKSFNAQTNIATEKILNVGSAAPGVIAANVTVVGAEHRIAFTGALYDVHQRRIRSELGVGECIGTPEIHIPFAIAVPLRAGRDICDLLHFFSRILAGAGVGGVGLIAETRRDRGFCFAAFATEQPGKGNKHIGYWRIVRAAK